MKYILLIGLFGPIFYKAFRYKKWYLYLLFALYGTLPDACGFEVSKSLPLLSVTRLLLLLSLVMLLYLKQKKLSFQISKIVVAYIGINIIISMFNFKYGFGEVNYIFILIFEQLLLVILVHNLIENELEFQTCIDFMIMGCVALAIIGIMQSVLNYDIATTLNWVEPRGVVRIQDRMGMTRAYATFNALSYGCYCAFMCLIIWYRYELTKKHLYIVALIINMAAFLLTMSRSSLLCLGIILIIMLLGRKGKLIKPFLKYIPILLCCMIALVLVYPSVLKATIATIKSILNTLGAHFEIASEFGTNATNGTYSRIRQWSTALYMLREGTLLFGYGYNGFAHGLAYYYNFQEKYWHVAKELDVGFVAFLISSGLAGLLSYLGLLGGIFCCAWSKRRIRKGFNFYKITLYIIPLLCMLEIASSFSVRHVEWLYFSLFFVYIKKIGVKAKV